jgi:hypothetical protein
VFNCGAGISVMLAQPGVQPDYAGAAAASAAASRLTHPIDHKEGARLPAAAHLPARCPATT